MDDGHANDRTEAPDHPDSGAAPTGSERRSAEILPFPSVGRRRRAAPSARPTLRQVVGDVLRDERLGQDRTLADVADAAHVSVPYLSEVERGRKHVSSDLLESICDALELPVPDLLERSARRIRRAGSGIGGRSTTMLAA